MTNDRKSVILFLSALGLFLPLFVTSIAIAQWLAIQTGLFDPVKDDHLNPAQVPALLHRLVSVIVFGSCVAILATPLQVFLYRLGKLAEQSEFDSNKSETGH